MDFPVVGAPGAIFEPASTSEALAIPTGYDPDDPMAERAWRLMRQRKHAQRQGCDGITIVFHDVNSLITENRPGNVALRSVVVSIDPDHIFVRRIFSYLCQIE